MQVEFIVKIKDSMKPPVFKEDLGKGVLEKRVVEINGLDGDISNGLVARTILELSEDIKNEWIEVKFKLKENE